MYHFTFFLILIIFSFFIYTNYRTLQKRKDPYIKHLRSLLIQVDPLFKSIPIETSSSSYTNKDVIYACVKDQDGEYYDSNTIIGVLLHELAHVKTPFFDPTHSSEEFRKNEEDLLMKARKLNLWSPDIQIPCDYCGVDMAGVSCRKRPGKDRIFKSIN